VTVAKTHSMSADTSSPSRKRAKPKESELAAEVEQVPPKKQRVRSKGKDTSPQPEDYPPRISSLWKVGAHVSAAGGIENAVQNAASIG
jgi:AP endonuclease 1